MKKLLNKLVTKFFKWIEYEGIIGPPGPPGPQGMRGLDAKVPDINKHPGYTTMCPFNTKGDGLGIETINIDCNFTSYCFNLEKNKEYILSFINYPQEQFAVTKIKLLFIKCKGGHIKFGDNIVFNSPSEMPIFKEGSTVVLEVMTMDGVTWYAKTIHGY